VTLYDELTAVLRALDADLLDLCRALARGAR
jgi:hypothetical protein